MAGNTCIQYIRPSGLSLLIYTSDVSLYDGPNLSCIPVSAGDGLNDIIASIDDVICGINEQLASLNQDASNISYAGTTSFGCFTITGTDMESVIEELATQICSINTDVTALNGTNITLGDAIVYDCLSFLSNQNLFDVIDAIAQEVCNQGADLDVIKAAYVPSATLNNVTNENNFVISGGNHTDSLLFTSINSSSYYIQGVKYTKSLVANIGLTATSDNYVDYNSGTNAYTVTAVTIGNPAPAIASGAIRIWKLTTDGTGVTASTDLRVYGFVDTTLLLDDSVSTAKIVDLAVTGAKIEDIGVAATIGDANIFTIDIDTKGRVTGYSFSIDLTGLAIGDSLVWDGTNWVKSTPNYIDGSGTANSLPVFSDANTITDSLFSDDGTTQALNATTSADIQFNVATIVDFGIYLQSSGGNTDNVGYYATVSGGTSTNVGFYGVAVGELAALLPADSNVGVFGSSVTLNSKDAYGAIFGVDGDGASTGKTIGLYVKAQSSGSGDVIGLIVEEGGAVFGATTKNAGAILQLDSTTQAFMPPGMTTTEKNAITAAERMVVYDTTLGKLCVYTGAAWETITSV